MDFKEVSINGYEKVVIATDSGTGLHAIIAVHNTNLGPAVGGTRLFPYSSEEEALNDVLRLAKGMTYKSALAGIDFGGGKSVIIAKPEQKTPELLRAFGQFVETFGGKYNCAEDVNTSVADMEIIQEKTKNVMGLSHLGGDPSPITALGVFSAIEATATKKLSKELKNIIICVQGVGNVGAHLIRHLSASGAKIYATDVNQERLNKLCAETGAIAVEPHEIHKIECDIFAPCAMGAILNERTIAELNCKAVVGAANNQLATEEDAERLKARGILYAPDYLVNAGGIINVFIEQRSEGYSKEKAEQAAKNIGTTLLKIYEIAERENITTSKAADRLAEERFLNPSLHLKKA